MELVARKEKRQQKSTRAQGSVPKLEDTTCADFFMGQEFPKEAARARADTGQRPTV